MGMETSGKVHAVFETQQVTERFRKREFVLELTDNPSYPQYVQFQLTGDRCGKLDHIQVGNSVRVEFSLRGRQWTSPKGEVRYFNSLDVWDVAVEESSAGLGDAPFDDSFPADDDAPF